MITSSVLDHRSTALPEVWPEVARRLTSQLRRKGVSQADAEDLVQECALRVLSAEPTWADVEDLLRWCNTVTRNLHTDLLRRRPLLAWDPEVDAPSADVDVHQEVTARLLLDELRASWHRLSARDQALLARAAEGDAAPAGDRREAVRENVARHRARQRLTGMLRGALSLSGVAAAVRRWGLPAVPAAGMAAAGLLLTIGPVPQPGDGGPASGPSAPRLTVLSTWVHDAPTTRVSTTPTAVEHPHTSGAARDQRPAARPSAPKQLAKSTLPTGDDATVTHDAGTVGRISVCVHDDGSTSVCADATALVGPGQGQPTARAASTSP